MDDPSVKFATPRVAAGALFVDRGRVLLVGKTYGNRWDIPGGYVDRGESPASACEREIREELGLERRISRLLVQDWAPSEAEGDKILYIFDCGSLGDDEDCVRLDGEEIGETQWVGIGDVDKFVIPRLARRLRNAYQAHLTDVILYLEHGEPRA
ncbi:MAG TPA: NUDIX hydrolase [Streptosporangiaceae bacterium]|nr:NUDIX hydrolase [Streptosporangiaceae bacterium]